MNSKLLEGKISFDTILNRIILMIMIVLISLYYIVTPPESTDNVNVFIVILAMIIFIGYLIYLIYDIKTVIDLRNQCQDSSVNLFKTWALILSSINFGLALISFIILFIFVILIILGKAGDGIGNINKPIKIIGIICVVLVGLYPITNMIMIWSGGFNSDYCS